MIAQKGMFQEVKDPPNEIVFANGISPWNSKTLLFLCFAFVLLVFIRRNKRDTFKNKAKSLIVITLLRIDEITDTHCTQRVFNIAHK